MRGADCTGPFYVFSVRYSCGIEADPQVSCDRHLRERYRALRAQLREVLRSEDIGVLEGLSWSQFVNTQAPVPSLEAIRSVLAR